MNNVNSLVVIGHITRDIGTTTDGFGYTPNGNARANVSIAVNRSVKKGEEWVDEVSYFDVTIWGKTAENLKPYLTKGKQIAVDGHLKQDRWEKDGQKRSKVYIVADSVELLGGKDDLSDNPKTENKAPSESTENPGSESCDDSEFPDDIPF